MKKGIINIIILILAGNVSAQRYLPGMRGIEFGGGVIESASGFHAQMGYSKYTFIKNRWFFNGAYLQRNYDTETGSVPVSQFTMSGGYYMRLVSDYTQSTVLSAGAAGLLGYETINWNGKMLADGSRIVNDDSFIFGVEACIEFEYYVDDRYALLLSIKQRASGGSTVRMFHTLFGIGIKYILD